MNQIALNQLINDNCLLSDFKFNLLIEKIYNNQKQIKKESKKAKKRNH